MWCMHVSAVAEQLCKACLSEHVNKCVSVDELLHACYGHQALSCGGCYVQSMTSAHCTAPSVQCYILNMVTAPSVQCYSLNIVTAPSVQCYSLNSVEPSHPVLAVVCS